MYVRLLGPFAATVGQPTTLCWRLERGGRAEQQPQAARISFEVLVEVRRGLAASDSITESRCCFACAAAVAVPFQFPVGTRQPADWRALCPSAPGPCLTPIAERPLAAIGAARGRRDVGGARRRGGHCGSHLGAPGGWHPAGACAEPAGC